MPSKAEMRCVWLKQAVKALDRLPPGQAAKVRGALPPGLLDQLEATSATAWVPAEWNVAVVTAVYQQLPKPQADELWLQKGLAILKQPLLEYSVGFFTAVMRVTPGDALAWAAKNTLGMGLLFRNCGRLELESVAAASAVLAHRELPEVLFSSEPWCESSRSTFAAILSLGRGELTSYGWDKALEPSGNVLRYRIGWRAQGS